MQNLNITRISLPSTNANYLPTDNWVSTPDSYLTYNKSGPLNENLWIDRSNTGFAQAPNDSSGYTVNGLRAGPVFNSVVLAIGSTLTKAAYSLGFTLRNDAKGQPLSTLLKAYGILKGPTGPMGWGDIADACGFDTSIWDTIPASSINTDFTTDTRNGSNPAIMHQQTAVKFGIYNTPYPASGTTQFWTAPNIANLQKSRFIDISLQNMVGFYADAEQDDGRSEQMFTLTFKGLASLSHALGLKFPFVSLDPLTGSGSNSGGDNKDLNGLLPYSRWFNIHAAANSTPDIVTSLQTQYAFYTGDPAGSATVDNSRLCIQLDVGASSKGNLISISATTAAANWALNNGIFNLLIINSGGSPSDAEFQQVVQAYLAVFPSS